MKKFFSFLTAAVCSASLMVLCISLFATIAHAQDTSPLPDTAFWSKLLEVLGGAKGMTVKGIVLAVVQLAVVFFRTSFSDFAGKTKLLVVLALSLLATVLGHIFTGMSVPAALLDGTTLAAFQVFAHQLVKHLNEKPQQTIQLGSR